MSQMRSPLLRTAARRVHTIARPAASVIDNETPVTVYEGKEYNDLSNIKWE